MIKLTYRYLIFIIFLSDEEESHPGEEKLKEDVQRALCDILGGQKFIRAGSYSTYFYDIGNSFSFCHETFMLPGHQGPMCYYINEGLSISCMQK